MVLNAFFENVVVYNVFYNLDVKVGERFTLVMDKPEEMTDVYVNNDKVLSHETVGTDINLEALAVGTSKIRIMKDEENATRVVREILVRIVDDIQRPATSLNASFGDPVNK